MTAPVALPRNVDRVFAPLKPLTEWLERGLRARIQADVARLLRERGLRRVLDLGCGKGDFSRRLADAGLWPLGVDTSPGMLAHAPAKEREGPHFRVVLGDVGRLPIQSGFDAAVLSLALHAVDAAAREATWAELQRVLCPDGLAVLVDFTLTEGAGLLGQWGRAYFRFDERQLAREEPEHYANYQAFMRQGGLVGWLRGHDGTVVEEHRYCAGSIGLLALLPNRSALRPSGAAPGSPDLAVPWPEPHWLRPGPARHTL